MFDFQPVRIDTGSADEDGVLVFRDGKLVAVAARLDNVDEELDLRGRWNVEAVFDRLPMPRHTFGDVQEMGRWLADHAGRTA